MADDGIKHSTVKLNGEGPIVLFIHGFPEAGALVLLAPPDPRPLLPRLPRRCSRSTCAADASKYTVFHTVGDLVALIDALGADKVFVVGHDWGAVVAWHLCLFRPDRVRALVNMSIPFGRRNPKFSPAVALKAVYGDDYYMCRFQAPGEMEGVIVEAGGAEKLLAKIFSYRTPAPFFFPKEQWFKDIPPRPTWMSEEEFAYFVSKFSQKGFTGGFNYYRAMNMNWELMAPWTGAQVLVPVKFIVGDLDLALYMPGAQDYVQKGGMLKDVPLLNEVVVLEGVGHFLQQEKPDEISKHIYDFIQNL